ncbi:hypothetical protein [Bacillus thuringiensis]|uniref:hypothetical protein n=1 Tax=Bacillus thuringiensis TaxID=1428 RepID=UPI000B49FB65|nr:hypothetical protein [Bacillus thuringiensis]MDH4423071.1 hypothetical protein [Bacillus cereus]PGL87892.1 hypothetical protein CN931_01530 [Bacillus sp. AFS054943]
MNYNYLLKNYIEGKGSTKETKQWSCESAFSFFGNAIIFYSYIEKVYYTKKQKQLIAVSAFSTIY